MEANQIPATETSAQTETKVEAKPETEVKETKPEIKEDEKLAPRFAALAKREKAILREQQKLKEYEAQVKAQQQKFESMESSLKQAQLNPLKALEALGLTYQQITDFILNGEKATPELEVKALREEMKSWQQQQLEAQQKAQEESLKAQQAQVQATIQDFKENLQQFISQNNEKYELISLNDAAELVYDTIEQYWENNQKILPMAEACDMVEKYFEDEHVNKLLSAKKVQNKLKPVEQKTEVKSGAKTLSNTLTASAAPGKLPPATESERIKRALAALERSQAQQA